MTLANYTFWSDNVAGWIQSNYPAAPRRVSMRAEHSGGTAVWFLELLAAQPSLCELIGVGSRAANRMLPPDPSSSTIPPRLEDWLALQGLTVTAIEPLVGDVSPRRYFRVRLSDSSTVLAAHYPPELRDAFHAGIRSTELLQAAGLRIASILGVDSRSEISLLEDLGEDSLFSVESGSRRAFDLYRQAIEICATVAQLDAEIVAELNPILGRDLLEQELTMTWKLFLGSRVEPGTFRRHLETALATLCGHLGDGPLVPCHRDFMARNLMVLPGDLLGVIDHQDLRLGPPHYDIASLLNDSTRLNARQTSDLADEAGVSGQPDYHRAAAQRCLKIVGTFQAFADRGSPRYLGMVPGALRRACGHLNRVGETRALVPALAKRLGVSLPEPPLEPRF